MTEPALPPADPAPQPAQQPAPTPEPARQVEPAAGAATPPGPIVTGGSGDGSATLEAGGDVSIGGDVVGRDVVTTTTTTTTGIGTQTIGSIRVGWSEAAVMRLALIVGALVFVTAACFFSGGLAVGGLVFSAFRDRPLAPSPQQAEAFQGRLDELEGTQSGQGFLLTLDEAELNAYVYYTLGEQIGFLPETGGARLINDNGANLIAIRGDYAPLGGRSVIATFALTETPGAPLQLMGASVRAFGGRDGGLGWVLVPNDWLRTIEIQANNLLGNVALERVVIPPDAPDGAQWEVTGEAR